jgi:hypothetical protein
MSQRQMPIASNHERGAYRLFLFLFSTSSFASRVRCMLCASASPLALSALAARLAIPVFSLDSPFSLVDFGLGTHLRLDC